MKKFINTYILMNKLTIEIRFISFIYQTGNFVRQNKSFANNLENCMINTKEKIQFNWNNCIKYHLQW